MVKKYYYYLKNIIIINLFIVNRVIIVSHFPLFYIIKYYIKEYKNINIVLVYK